MADDTKIKQKNKYIDFVSKYDKESKVKASAPKISSRVTTEKKLIDKGAKLYTKEEISKLNQFEKVILRTGGKLTKAKEEISHNLKKMERLKELKAKGEPVGAAIKKRKKDIKNLSKIVVANTDQIKGIPRKINEIHKKIFKRSKDFLDHLTRKKILIKKSQGGRRTVSIIKGMSKNEAIKILIRNLKGGRSVGAAKTRLMTKLLVSSGGKLGLVKRISVSSLKVGAIVGAGILAQKLINSQLSNRPNADRVHSERTKRFLANASNTPLPSGVLMGKAAKKASKGGKGRWVTMRGRKVFIPE